MVVDPRRLRIHLAVVRARGVVGASRILHLTPQAVSQQIASLEAELGVRLFDRSQRRLAPTAVGRALARHAERIEDELAAAFRTVAAATGRATGTVRIAAFQSAIRWLVVEALPILRARQPGVVPMVIELSGKGVDKALRAGEVDLVIDERDEAPAPEPALAVRLLRRDPYSLVAAPRIARRVRGVRALAAERWIAAPSGSSCHSALKRLAAQWGFEPDVAHVCLEFPSVLAMVAAGEGVALVPELALADGGAVERCKVRGLGERKVLLLQRTSRRGTEPAVDAVVKALLGST